MLGLELTTIIWILLGWNIYLTMKMPNADAILRNFNHHGKVIDAHADLIDDAERRISNIEYNINL